MKKLENFFNIFYIFFDILFYLSFFKKKLANKSSDYQVYFRQIPPKVWIIHG